MALLGQMRFFSVVYQSQCSLYVKKQKLRTMLHPIMIHNCYCTLCYHSTNVRYGTNSKYTSSYSYLSLISNSVPFVFNFFLACLSICRKFDNFSGTKPHLSGLVSQQVRSTCLVSLLSVLIRVCERVCSCARKT